MVAFVSILRRRVVICSYCHDGLTVMPKKGSALDYALAFAVVVFVILATGMLLGYVSTDVTLQLITAFK